MRIFFWCALVASLSVCVVPNLVGMDSLHHTKVQSTNVLQVMIHHVPDDPHAADHVIIDVKPEPLAEQQEIPQQQTFFMYRLLQTNVQQQVAQVANAQIFAILAKLNLQENGESV